MSILTWLRFIVGSRRANSTNCRDSSGIVAGAVVCTRRRARTGVRRKGSVAGTLVLGCSARCFVGHFDGPLRAVVRDRRAEERLAATILANVSGICDVVLDDRPVGLLLRVACGTIFHRGECDSGQFDFAGDCFCVAHRADDSHCASILWHPPFGAFVSVMFFADTVALALLFVMPLPMFNIMGGIPLSASEQIIQSAALFVGCVGFPSWFLWCLGVLFLARIAAWQPPVQEIGAVGRVSLWLWVCATVMILGWAFVLPSTQREQRLRSEVERSSPSRSH